MRLSQADSFVFLVAALVLLSASIGCRNKTVVAEKDEAYRRAEALEVNPQDAAKDWFLPEHYYRSDYEAYSGDAANEGDEDGSSNNAGGYDSDKPSADPSDNDYYNSPIVDYFPGMDRVALLGSEGNEQDPLDFGRIPTPQLLDIYKKAHTQGAGGEANSDGANGPGQHSLELLEDIDLVQRVRTPSEILGRNTWMAWCGGNEGFWDWLARKGFIDLLKLTDSRRRQSRFDEAGMINEPGMQRTRVPRPGMYGLWVDEPTDPEAKKERDAYLQEAFNSILAGTYDEFATSFANMSRKEYPYKNIVPPDVYGVSTGIVGLRLFPNPNFDAKALREWDAERYYNDRDYYLNPELVRPFRVGVSCAFCHASYHPLNPPDDFTNPKWENLSGSIGAQYLRTRATFGNLLEADNFIYHILDSQPPGTIDTSLIASDSINNPNTMNAVFNLPQRALLAFSNPAETISQASETQPNLWRNLPSRPSQNSGEDEPNNEDNGSYAKNDRDDNGNSYGRYEYLTRDPVPSAYQDLFAGLNLAEALRQSNDKTRAVPRILLDGADSIGGWGAFARVYLNIGTYYEQWNQVHRPVIGFEEQRRFTIQDCDENSVYWMATQDRVSALRDYFLKVSNGMPLVAVPGELDEIKEELLPRGRQVFARNCLVCHSSIQPETPAGLFHISEKTLDAHNLAAGSPERREFDDKFESLIARRRKYRGLDAEPPRSDREGVEVSANHFFEHNPGRWVHDEDYQLWAKMAVEEEDFWRYNYLSTDMRVPVNLVETNSSRAMATNALAGNMWDDFASDTYQLLPSVGQIKYFNPYAGEHGEYEYYSPRHKHHAPAVTTDDSTREVFAEEGGGGPGYYRVPTLVSIWATAPYFHNNSLGEFNNDPSVDGRKRAFQDGIEKLLWPEKRLESSSYNGATPERLAADHGLIWRTDRETYLTINAGSVPDGLSQEVAWIMGIRESNDWLKSVTPLWLPSAILMVVSFVLLTANTPRKLKWAAWGLVAIGLIAIPFELRGVMEGEWRKEAWWGRFWFTLFVLFLAFIVWTVASSDHWRQYWKRVIAVGFVLLITMGLLYLFNLPLYERWSLLLILSIVLIFFSSFVFWVSQREYAQRFVSYGMLVLAASIGGILYFFNGQAGDIRIGPFPKGTPINLIANVNPDAEPEKLKKAIVLTLDALNEIKSHEGDDSWTEEDSLALLREEALPALMEVNKCPDFVMDRGHDFDWFDDMDDDDKEALIELLKTF